MWEVAFQEYVASGAELTPPGSVGQGDGGEYSGPASQNFQQWSDYPDDPPPTTEEEFVADVVETLAGTGATLDPDDLALITPEEWESFLAALLGFVSEPHGSDQNSYYADHSNEAPLGEYFIEQWGFLPSVQQMPGYHYFDYLTQDIDPEFLEWAYAAHEAASVFAESDLSLAEIENIPFQLMVDGRAITFVWHSGVAPAANLHADPNDPNHVIVHCSNGYFSVQAQPPPGGDHTPSALDFMEWTTANLPYMAAVNQALHYLDDSPTARQLLRAAFAARVQIVIVTGHSETGYDPISNSVFWNPTAGLRLTNGGLMSPAMALLHELAHAIVHLPNTPTGDLYGNVEDRYIIQYYESVIATELGEPSRQNHGGAFEWDQTDVTHSEPAPDLDDFEI